MQASLHDEAAAVCLLIEMEHPLGTIHVATALESIEWNDQVWIGVGYVGGIEGLEESAKVEVREVLFTLNGTDDQLINGLSSSVKGHKATIRHALLDSRNRVVGDPEIVDAVELDDQNYDVDVQTGQAMIKINSYSAIVDLRTSADTYITPEMQRARFDGDFGCDVIPDLVDRQVSWNAAT